MSRGSQRLVSSKVFYDLASCLVPLHVVLQPQKHSSLYFLALSLYSAVSLVLCFMSSFLSSDSYTISVYSFPFLCLLATVDT